MRIIPTVILISIALSVSGQISIQVIDVENNEPLPFTTVLLAQTSSGFIADIDGKIELPKLPPNQELVIKHMGYQPQTLSFSKLALKSTVHLTPLTQRLETVIIDAGENPAHSIIRQLVENKEFLNPEAMDQYSLLSKNSFNIGTDHFPKTNTKDSSYLKLQKMLSAQYLFSMTSVTRRYYQAPNKEKEVVVANRVSGFQNPQFAAMAKSLQNIGFYEDHLIILDIPFLNPISKNSFDNYFFGLEDSLLDASGRKNYVISFEPIKSTFNGLSGTLYIDAEDMAIRHVIAETVRFTEIHDQLSKGQPLMPGQAKNEYNLYNYLTVNFRLQQSYDRLSKDKWFPDEQNADVMIGEFSKKNAPAIPIYIYSKSQFSEISLDALPDSVKFDRVRLEYLPEVNNRPVETSFKDDSIDFSKKQLETQNVLDSIFQANNLEQKLGVIQGLIFGEINWKWIDFDLRNSLKLNDFEGVRLGLALNTSQSLSKLLEFGGNFGYGIRDRAWKYGAYGLIKLLNKERLNLKFSYQQDIRRFGSHEFFKYRDFPTGTESFYPFLFDNMLSVEQYKVNVGGYAFRYLNGYASISQQRIAHPSLLLMPDPARYLFITELAAGLSYTPGEDLLTIGNAWLPTARSNSYLGLNVMQGINILNGNHRYTKLNMLLQRKWQTRGFGVPILTLNVGTVAGDIPSTQLYALQGSSSKSYLDVSNTFRTMGVSEFLAGTYVNVFYQHKIFQFTVHPRWSKPQVELHSGWAFGRSASLEGESLIQNSAFRYLDDHYLESGLKIRHLIRWNTLSGGIGFFYRYGPYATDQYQDNLAITFDLGFNTGE